jgi:hypothetical protein
MQRGFRSVLTLLGISKDLGLSATQYSTVVAVLFAGYVGFQVPSNMLASTIKWPGICGSPHSSPRPLPPPPLPLTPRPLSTRLTCRYLCLVRSLGYGLGFDWCRAQLCGPRRLSSRLGYHRRSVARLLLPSGFGLTHQLPSSRELSTSSRVSTKKSEWPSERPSCTRALRLE